MRSSKLFCTYYGYTMVIHTYSLPYLSYLSWMALAMKFNKRTYSSPKEFFTDLCFPIRNRKRLKEVKNKGLLSQAFRERLMLAVTAVYGCRYCSYFHAKLALKDGISQEEIGHLLSGDVDGCPAKEAMAVLYAQYWAESNAHPDPEAVQKLQKVYGFEKAEAIHLMLRMIRLGNLLGNSWDYLLYCISFGKWRG
jgi:AhpD family alkylhydroperoxidase